MKRTYTAEVRLPNGSITRQFETPSACRRYMSEMAGRFMFENGYSLVDTRCLGSFVYNIRLALGTRRVSISFIREA